MRRTLTALAVAVLAAPGAAAVPAANPALEEAAAAGLLGSVHGPDGGPLGGVAVYARGVDRTITTTVFTDAGGEYVFPALEPGPYRLWAQAVGFEASRAAVTLCAAERARHAFALRAIADVAPQLSEAEWMAALPAGTQAERRMKEILRVNSRGRTFVRDRIARGSADMPGQQHSLSPRQIDQVVAYLETRTPAERPAGEPGWW